MLHRVTHLNSNWLEETGTNKKTRIAWANKHKEQTIDLYSGVASQNLNFILTIAVSL